MNEKQVAWRGVVLGHGDQPGCKHHLIALSNRNNVHLCLFLLLLAFTLSRPHTATKAPYTNQSNPHLQGSHDVARLVALAVGQQADDVVLLCLLGVLAARHGNVLQRLSEERPRCRWGRGRGRRSWTLASRLCGVMAMSFSVCQVRKVQGEGVDDGAGEGMQVGVRQRGRRS